MSRKQDVHLPIRTLNEVVDNGYCSGCGACAYVAGMSMTVNDFGEYVPASATAEAVGTDVEGRAEAACPFLSPELNEDALAKPLFADNCQYDGRIGFYSMAFGGYVREGDYREQGTSGGMGTWVAVELMRKGLIDGFIHVKPIDRPAEGGPFFRYAISRSISDIEAGAKTRYHVVEIADVMREVRNSPGRYAFIGVPCFAKAVRRLQLIDPTIRDRVKYVIALVCGHLKSIHWTLSLAWAAGIHPNELGGFQYRTKGAGIPSRAYVYRAFPRHDKTSNQQRHAASVMGGRFNQGAMMLNACDYCDDVVGETADLTVGDAWLPQFDIDPRGTNLLIVRNVELGQMLLAAKNDERIHLEQLTAKQAGDSQAGGFRHRREGLSHRLALAVAKRQATPVKRVRPGEFRISSLRGRIYEMRVAVAAISRRAFRSALDADDYRVYVQQMKPALRKLRSLELRSVFLRAGWGRVKRHGRRLLRIVVPSR